MKIETERLELLPLNARQLRLWLEDHSLLEQELDCSYQAQPMEGIFRDIVAGQLSVTEKDDGQYTWHSFWFLIRKSDRVVVGSADFKDVPNEAGEVEIGYGLGRRFEHNGYMTEAVRAMCKWALSKDEVTHVIAETEKDSFASQRILERCGFTQTSCRDTIWWRT